jgi:hypothetical protein
VQLEVNGQHAELQRRQNETFTTQVRVPVIGRNIKMNQFWLLVVRLVPCCSFPGAAESLYVWVSTDDEDCI